MEPEIRHKPVRYYEIDALRFAAAFAVVLYHFTYRGYHADHASPVEYPVLGEIFKYGHLGVQLFFIISGYVVLLSAQGKTVGQFFVSRVMRLYPAYWAACTLCFVVVRAFGPAVHAAGWSDMLAAPVGRYLAGLTMLNSFFGVADLDGVYWTLSFEIRFYFLIALVVAFQWTRHLVAVLAVWLAYCALAGTGLDENAFGMLLFPRFAPYFIAGMVFYLLQTSQAARWQLYALLLAAYVLGVRGARATFNELMNTTFHQPFSWAVTALVLTSFFAVFWLIIRRKIALQPAAWLTWAGALTYPVYLLHHNMGFVAFQRLGGRLDKYLLLALVVAAVLGVAVLVHVGVERRYGKALGNKLLLLARA